ncbi:MAG: hypothetical protein ABR866_13515 [Candidatus Korobacteraceae bacterium]
MNKAEFAIALADTKHYLFVVEFSSVSLMVTADVGLIDLNRAVQHRAIRLEHGSADAMAEIPCCLVADSKFPLHLICGVPLAGFAHQKSSNEPFRQGQVRVIKDRTSGHRELIITVFAVEQLLRRRQLRNRTVTAGTLRRVRPTQAAKHFTAFFVGIKQIHHVNQRHKAPHE